MKSLISLFVFIFSLAGVLVSAETEAKRASPTNTCAVPGYDKGTKPYYTSSSRFFANVYGCGIRCKVDKKCKTFAVGQGVCRNYGTSMPNNFKQVANSPYKFYSKSCNVMYPAPPQDRCGLIGYEKNRAYFLSYSTKTTDLGWTGCSNLCKRTRNCRSYAVGKRSCRLFNSNVTNNFKADSNSPFAFYDLSCKAPTTPTSPSQTVSTPTITNSTPTVTDSTPTVTDSTPTVTDSTPTVTDSTPTVTDSTPTVTDSTPTVTDSTSTVTDSTPTASDSTPTTPDTTPTTPDTTSPTSTDNGQIPTSDSPPLSDTEPVVFPTDDDQFTVTYSFQDDPLPTVTEMGVPPITTGLAGPTDVPTLSECMINPDDGTSFELLQPRNMIPLIMLPQNKLGPIPTPKSEAEAAALGPPEDYPVPSFKFTGGSSGLYDLVTAQEPTLYVGKAQNGDVVLVDHSTGTGGETINGVKVVTALFEVTCKGRVTVTQGGQSYDWAVSGATTKMTTTSSRDGTMYTLPKNNNNAPAASRNRRRSKWTDGAAPRCPKSPSPLEARVRPGARGLNPNGCGAADGPDLVPDFSFGGCCNEHDNCFDDCNGKTFEQCNTEFHDCMRGPGCAGVDHWYTYPLWVGCIKTANFYYSVVSGYLGMKAFYASNKERCGCYCSGNWPDMCNVGGTPNCLNVRGSDMDNCGACGRKCSAAGARCSGGQCVCANDQCGDRCVNLRNHPRNCGACGHKCDSGYCVGGQCYTPPPGTCTPGEGFKNGNFAKGQEGWTFTNTRGRPGGVGFDAGAQDEDRLDAAIVVQASRSDDASSAAYNPTASMSTTVKMCPGAARMQLSFKTRRVRGADSCVYSYSFGGVASAFTWAVPDGFGFTAKVADDVPVFGEANGGAVRKNGAELLVRFDLNFVCYNGDGLNSIRIDEFSLVPV